MNITIEHRPGGKWRLVMAMPQGNGREAIKASALHDYEQRIIWAGYAAQTQYWGAERVWETKPNSIPHRTVDKSLEPLPSNEH